MVGFHMKREKEIKEAFWIGISVSHVVPFKQVAFLIYRPVMRLFKCQKNSESLWPLDCSEPANAITADSESETGDSLDTLVLVLDSSRKTIM